MLTGESVGRSRQKPDIFLHVLYNIVLQRQQGWDININARAFNTCIHRACKRSLHRSCRTRFHSCGSR
ncbi:hypothetical protein M413DRAFT_438473 [Hebeloma cylindrosporum]|uniref:Uncharacterized protein n=1 Tax=Hebeloma cylindrosporum TaxID=76867 RepID=A0A0C3CYP5_HEBCY|nr:hypothetical protein M413DRAFT_438473 [Hebeloma cylindrosporum h7]